jgi:hypothetical protein
MPDVKYTSGKGTEAERVNARLRNSGAGAGNPGHTVVKNGEGPTRSFTNIHHGAGHTPVRGERDDRSER